MQILIVVPHITYWRAYLEDLRRVLEIQKAGNYMVMAGNVIYRMCLVDRHSWRGLRPEKVYVYNCDRHNTDMDELLYMLSYFEAVGIQTERIWN